MLSVIETIIRHHEEEAGSPFLAPLDLTLKARWGSSSYRACNTIMKAVVSLDRSIEQGEMSNAHMLNTLLNMAALGLWPTRFSNGRLLVQLTGPWASVCAQCGRFTNPSTPGHPEGVVRIFDSYGPIAFICYICHGVRFARRSQGHFPFPYHRSCS
jgi:hypothetical protein